LVDFELSPPSVFADGCLLGAAGDVELGFVELDPEQPI
jgi:hypothetical protein